MSLARRHPGSGQTHLRAVVTMDAHGTDELVGWLVVLLHKELRIAWVAALGRGVDPVELSRSIAERLRWLRAAGVSGRA